jgi:hypothetical protein
MSQPPPLVARLHERETRSKRVVLVAKVADAIPPGAWVALFDVRGELFLGVVLDDAPEILSAKEVTQRIRL